MVPRFYAPPPIFAEQPTSAPVWALGCHAAQPLASKAEWENAESAKELLLAAALRRACISSQARPKYGLSALKQRHVASS